MNQLLTIGIVLTRTDYGEADRIVTLITPDNGKLRLMAHGVRKIKSRAAGGIELFSISEISFIHGKGALGTLISARLIKHYGSIVQDITRVQLGYELIKMLHRATEDQLDKEYFELLQRAYDALNKPMIQLELISLWFQAQLLRFGGHTPNLQSDVNQQKLTATMTYIFDYDRVAFKPQTDGLFTSTHIKVLRLLFSQNQPQDIDAVNGVRALLPDVAPLITVMKITYTRT